MKLDVDIHQGSIRRIDTTVSTKEMMNDVDVSTACHYDRSHVYLHVETPDKLWPLWNLCGKKKSRGRKTSVKLALWFVVVYDGMCVKFATNGLFI